MFMIINKLPILVIRNNNLLAFNFSQFFLRKPNIILNTFFTFQELQVIQQTIGNFENFANLLLNTNPVAFNNDDVADRHEHDKEPTNAVYKNYYADGQFTGIVSPQANDFFQSNETNVQSNFNNTSVIKCIFQTAMLANIFNTLNYYTLTNGCAIIRFDENQNMSYTGKYWVKSITSNVDNDNQQNINVTTEQLLTRLCTRINQDNALKQEIQRELGIAFPNKNRPDATYYTVREELNFNRLENRSLVNQAIFANRLFFSTCGLEDPYKIEFALTFSGILGHSWDYLLRFFLFNTNAETDRQFNDFRINYPSFEFVKHNGTPIASYIYDFKNGTTTNNILGGYNAVNFSRVLNYKIINIRDKISTKTIYSPPPTPNCLIPIVFNNALLQCKTKCYRSYRKLLNLMKTRKQRDYLFDRLTHYGRRCMTILDPYGIFMHFHDDSRGIRPS